MQAWISTSLSLGSCLLHPSCQAEGGFRVFPAMPSLSPFQTWLAFLFRSSWNSVVNTSLVYLTPCAGPAVLGAPGWLSG